MLHQEISFPSQPLLSSRQDINLDRVKFLSSYESEEKILIHFLYNIPLFSQSTLMMPVSSPITAVLRVLAPYTVSTYPVGMPGV